MKSETKRTTRGRPPVNDADRLKRRNVTLSDEMVAKARRIGGGNVSEGIRRALEEYPHGG